MLTGTARDRPRTHSWGCSRRTAGPADTAAPPCTAGTARRRPASPAPSPAETPRRLHPAPLPPRPTWQRHHLKTLDLSATRTVRYRGLDLVEGFIFNIYSSRFLTFWVKFFFRLHVLAVSDLPLIDLLQHRGQTTIVTAACLCILYLMKISR